jgi:hypothetical protein
MGTLPVDAVTYKTRLKIVIALPYHGRQTLKNHILLDGDKKRVASKATLQRSHRCEKIKALQDLNHLQLRIDLPHSICPGQSPLLNELPVAAQESPFVEIRESNELIVVKVGTIERVEAKHAEVVRQLAKVAIKDEPGFSERMLANACNQGNVIRLEHRIHTDRVILFDSIVEVNRNAIGKHKIHRGLRHIQG